MLRKHIPLTEETKDPNIDYSLVKPYPLANDIYAHPDGHVFIGVHENGGYRLYKIIPYLNHYSGVKYGYYRFTFKGQMYKIHQIIAHTFVPGYKEGLIVDHINEDSRDNRAINLRWITLSENTKKFWKVSSKEYGEEQRKKYSEGVRKAHALGHYDNHLNKLHNKGEK